MNPFAASLPRLACAVLLAVALMALYGCSFGGDDRPVAASTSSGTAMGTLPNAPAQGANSGASAAVSVVDPASPAALAIATREAKRSGLPVEAGTVVRVVRAQKATGGYALWSFQAKELTLCMIISPSGRGVSWSGSAQRFDEVDRCAGAAVAPSTLVLAGRAGPNVASVRVVTRSGAKRPVVLGAGGWLYVDSALPLKDDRNGGIPAAVEALDGSGNVVGRERFPA